MRMPSSWHFVIGLSAKGTLTGIFAGQAPQIRTRARKDVQDHVRHNAVGRTLRVPTLGSGHECQRQAPARWPATLQPRWGAPGEDLAVRQEAGWQARPAVLRAC